MPHEGDHIGGDIGSELHQALSRMNGVRIGNHSILLAMDQMQGAVLRGKLGQLTETPRQRNDSRGQAGLLLR